MQRKYLYGFSVKTVIKMNINLLHSVLLYYVAFGIFYVKQYFAIHMMWRFPEILRCQQKQVFTNPIV